MKDHPEQEQPHERQPAARQPRRTIEDRERGRLDALDAERARQLAALAAAIASEGATHADA